MAPMRRKADVGLGLARPEIVIPFALLAIGWGVAGHAKVTKLEAEQAQAPEFSEFRSREIDDLKADVRELRAAIRACAERKT